MKKLTMSLCALVALASAAFAGPASVQSSSKNVQQQANETTASCFADREWNVDLFGNYAWTQHGRERYIGQDHAFGGGIDVNYIFARYFGVGLEGYALDARDAIGQVSGNVLVRFPIDRICLAPYAFAGGGVVFNGSKVGDRLANGQIGNARKSADSEGIAQFGGGLEYRFTPHVGIMNDFTWTVVNGHDNNYGMIRTGVRFAF